MLIDMYGVWTRFVSLAQYCLAVSVAGGGRGGGG